MLLFALQISTFLLMLQKSLKSEAVFWLHLLLVIGAWVGPFVISWKILVPAYLLVMLQFAVFDRCLMNEHHGLDEKADDRIFYTDLLERIGFRPNRKMLKRFVRRYLYLLLSAVALLWQVAL